MRVDMPEVFCDVPLLSVVATVAEKVMLRRWREDPVHGGKGGAG